MQDINGRRNRHSFLQALALGGGLLALALAACATTRADNAADDTLPTGRQYTIRRGDMAATVTEQGAGLRSFSVGGREVLDTYRQDQPCDSGRGQVLLPWPNRIDKGAYTFNGATEQAGLNESARNNAIHGLTRWMNWNLSMQESDRVVLSLVLHAQEGYPFVLALEQVYALTDRGLEVQTSARNVGTTPLPYGAGYHPYITVGTQFINSATLRIPARTYFRTDERLIPILPAVSVEGTPYDFSEARTIDETVMDTGFADLIRDRDGFARVTLSAPGGHPSVTVFMDASLPFLQIYTGDTLSAPAAQRRGVAIEPYSCASNAFNNQLGLRVLQPGETFTTHWGISATQ